MKGIVEGQSHEHLFSAFPSPVTIVQTQDSSYSMASFNGLEISVTVLV